MRMKLLVLQKMCQRRSGTHHNQTQIMVQIMAEPRMKNKKWCRKVQNLVKMQLNIDKMARIFTYQRTSIQIKTLKRVLSLQSLHIMLWDLKQVTFTDVSQMVAARAIVPTSSDKRKRKKRNARAYGAQQLVTSEAPGKAPSIPKVLKTAQMPWRRLHLN